MASGGLTSPDAGKNIKGPPAGRSPAGEKGGSQVEWMLDEGTWPVILAAVLAALALFRRPLAWLLRLLCRSALGLGFLALWAKSGLAAGLALGVNGFNALTLGLLGLPGFGLLFLLRWAGG